MARTDKFTRLDQTRNTLLKVRSKRAARRTRPQVPPITEQLVMHTDVVLAVMGLRVASHLGREDLRSEYARVADLLSTVRPEMFLEDGDGI